MSSNDPVRDAANKLIGSAIDRVPEGSPLRQFLVQAGWLGLILGVLIGNVPVTVLIAAVVKGEATLNAGAMETYFTVFVLVTPWVFVAGLLSYWEASGTTPQMSGYGFIATIAGLIFVAGLVSVWFGGVVPAEVAAGPDSGSPGGATEYAVDSLGSYLALYGPWPPLAGALEGAFFGYWIAALNKG